MVLVRWGTYLWWSSSAEPSSIVKTSAQPRRPVLQFPTGQSGPPAQPPVASTPKRQADQPITGQVSQLTQSFDKLPKALVGERTEMFEPERRYIVRRASDGESLRAFEENQQDNQNGGQENG